MSKKFEVYSGGNLPHLELDERNMMIQQLMHQNVRELQNKVERIFIDQQSIKEEVSQVKSDLNNKITLDYGQQQALLNAKKRHVEKLWRDGRYNPVIHDTKRKLHGAAGSYLKNAFGVSSYRDIKANQFEEAVRCIQEWKPRIV